MCYICEAQGHVGPHYKQALRAIKAALRAWKPALKHYDAPPAAPKPANGDWLTEPKRPKPWTAREFQAYQTRTRYNPLPGSGTSPALSISEADLRKLRALPWSIQKGA